MSHPSLPESPPAEAPQAGATPRVELVLDEETQNKVDEFATGIEKDMRLNDMSPDEVLKIIFSNEDDLKLLVYLRQTHPALYGKLVPEEQLETVNAGLDRVAACLLRASPPAAPTSSPPAPPAPPAPMPPAAPTSATPQVTRCPQGASPGPRTSLVVGRHPSNIHGAGTSNASESTEMTNDTSLASNSVVLPNWADAVGPTVHGCSNALAKIGPGTAGLLGLLFLFEVVSYFVIFNNLGPLTITFFAAFATAFACFMISRKEWQDGKK